MEKKFYEEYYDTFLDLSEAPEEDALTEEEVRYYISEAFEPYTNLKRGNIVFVSTFAYPNGQIGKNHLFVLIDKDKYVPFEYFGMIISSRIDKERFKYNIRLNKDNVNHLDKDSIVKTDYIYKLKEDNVSHVVGNLNEDVIEYFEEKYKEYLNEKC